MTVHDTAALIDYPENAAESMTQRTVGRATLAVFEKDWRSERRTRAALNSVVLFAVAAPVALSFSVARQILSPEVLAGSLWTVLLFAALVGLSRGFRQEGGSGT